MPAQRSFPVFGDPVEVLSATSVFSVGTQLCQPGGGPPPHFHLHEDEFFFPVDGSQFEMFDGASNTWLPLGPEGHYSPRGSVHTFRNAGSSVGKILFIVNSDCLMSYLERISSLTLPQDLQTLIDISATYGITFTFPGCPKPTTLMSSELTHV